MLDIPHAREHDQIKVDDLGDPADAVTLVTGRFGYRDHPDVPRALNIAKEQSRELGALADPTYFLSRIVIMPVPGGDMPMWRKRIFAALALNASSPVAYFWLQEDQVITLGGVIEI
jgi:KUP system potassium uptake protein